MPCSRNDLVSASRPNCGYRFEPGNIRTSATSLIPFCCKSERKMSILRVECPMVQIREIILFLLLSPVPDKFRDNQRMNMKKSLLSEIVGFATLALMQGA